MEEISRHFMMRRLGRGIVTARIVDNGCVFIEVFFGNSPDKQQRAMLHLAADKAKLFDLDGIGLLYRLSRIALSQIQSIISRNEQVTSSPTELNVALMPWNGDLTDTRYGGATIGCTRLFESK